MQINDVSPRIHKETARFTDNSKSSMNGRITTNLHRNALVRSRFPFSPVWFPGALLHLSISVGNFLGDRDQLAVFNSIHHIAELFYILEMMRRQKDGLAFRF